MELGPCFKVLCSAPDCSQKLLCRISTKLLSSQRCLPLRLVGVSKAGLEGGLLLLHYPKKLNKGSYSILRFRGCVIHEHILCALVIWVSTLIASYPLAFLSLRVPRYPCLFM